MTELMTPIERDCRATCQRFVMYKEIAPDAKLALEWRGKFAGALLRAVHANETWMGTRLGTERTVLEVEFEYRCLHPTMAREVYSYALERRLCRLDHMIVDRATGKMRYIADVLLDRATREDCSQIAQREETPDAAVVRACDILSATIFFFPVSIILHRFDSHGATSIGPCTLRRIVYCELACIHCRISVLVAFSRDSAALVNFSLTECIEFVKKERDMVCSDHDTERARAKLQVRAVKWVSVLLGGRLATVAMAMRAFDLPVLVLLEVFFCEQENFSELQLRRAWQIAALIKHAPMDNDECGENSN